MQTANWAYRRVVIRDSQANKKTLYCGKAKVDNNHLCNFVCSHKYRSTVVSNLIKEDDFTAEGVNFAAERASQEHLLLRFLFA